MLPPLDALLFDLGRVILDIDMRRIHDVWAAHEGVPAERFDRHHAEIISSETFHAHERGEITDAQFWEYLRRTLELPLTDAQFLDGWNSIFLGEMAGIRDVLARITGKLPLYVFSNTNPAHEAHWSMAFADVLQPFEKIYTSNGIGARKPEAAAFAKVVADMGVAPQRVLFFDDVAENIEGARASGLQAVHVTTTSDIARALAMLGL